MESASTISFMYILHLFYVISRSDFFLVKLFQVLQNLLKKISNIYNTKQTNYQTSSKTNLVV